jgi:hypothetical protein
MQRNRKHETKYIKINNVLRDTEQCLLLCNLINKYLYFSNRQLKIWGGFEYHFYRIKEDIKHEIAIPKNRYETKLKKLQENNYINYKGSVHPKGKYTTTLWWLNIPKIEQDFGIDLDKKGIPKEINNTMKLTETMGNKDKRDILILSHLLSKYKKKIKKQNDFEYHFCYSKTDMAIDLSIPKSILHQKLKRLKDWGYLDYTGGYNPDKYTTTLWWLNILKIEQDFGIDLYTKAPKAEQKCSSPPEHDSSIPEKETDTNNTVFDIDILPEPEKNLFKHFKSIESNIEREKAMKKHRYAITNAEVKINAFNKAYPPTTK